MEAVLRARTLLETRGFIKALVEIDSDRILGFTMFGVDAGEVMTSVQTLWWAGFLIRCFGILVHPIMVEGLIPLFSSALHYRSLLMREALKLENARLSSRAEFDKGPEKRLEAQSTVVQTLARRRCGVIIDAAA